MSEKSLLNKLMIRATELGGRLFRNNVGVAWVGTKIDKLSNGDIILRSPRVIRYGLCVGSSDLIGWMPVVVTQDMVGKKIAMFTAVEAKVGGLRLTTEQKDFLFSVDAHGGIAVLARDVDDLLKDLKM